MKKYIKLNNNDNHLSLGNFTRIIKENTINKTSALQTEVFSTLFNTANINDTTINNYCIGIRSINNDYKQQYIIYKKNYPKDNYILLDIIINLLTINSLIFFLSFFNFIYRSGKIDNVDTVFLMS